MADEADEDLYTGFNDPDSSTHSFLSSAQFQDVARKTSLRQFRLPTPNISSMKQRLAAPGSSLTPQAEEGEGSTGSTRSFGGSSSSRRAQQSGGLDGGPKVEVRSNKAAGFTSSNRDVGALVEEKEGFVASRVESKERIVEKKLREIEGVMCESEILKGEGRLGEALEKAEESIRQYTRQFSDGPDNPSTEEERTLADLYYSLNLCLADKLSTAGYFTNALQVYVNLLKHPSNTQKGLLRTMIGNVHFMMGNYRPAIKSYSMGCDQVHGCEHERLRRRLRLNVGVACFRLHKVEDATVTFTQVAEDEQSVRAWFGVISSRYALGEIDEMKEAFTRMVEDRKDSAWYDQPYPSLLSRALPGDQGLGSETEKVPGDELKRWVGARQEADEEMVCRGAKMIAESMGAEFDKGYDWCISQLGMSRFGKLIVNLEIDKTIAFIRRNDYKKAVDTLAQFDRNYALISGSAATNLAFLEYLVGSTGDKLAEVFVDIALKTDSYNPAAYVNKGNIFYGRGEFNKAEVCYSQAWAYDASCLESIYNLGLAAKQLGRLVESVACFVKLQETLGPTPQVLYQLGDLYERLGDTERSADCFVRCLALVPTDSGVLTRLAETYHNSGDMSQAYLYYTDAYRCDPTNTRAIRWLGEYYVRSQCVEKALEFFEKGFLAQPNVLYWGMSAAYCHKRAGNIDRALSVYRDLSTRFPHNIDSLLALVRLCQDLNLSKEFEYYDRRLKAAERLESTHLRSRLRCRGTAGYHRDVEGECCSHGPGRDCQQDCCYGDESRLSSAKSRCTEEDVIDGERLRGSGGVRGGERWRAGFEREGGMSSGDALLINDSYDDPMPDGLPKRPHTSCSRQKTLRDADFEEEGVLGEDLLPD